MEFRILKSSFGRYRVQKRRFIFWRDCCKPLFSLDQARATKKSNEKYYHKEKKEKEVWNILLY